MKKIIEALKKYPASPFILIIFVFVHAYNYAYKWMWIPDLSEAFIYSITSIILAFFILKKLLKSSIKSAIITSLLILVFFYIGFLKDFILNLTGSYIHLRYSIPIILIILILLFLKVRKIDSSKVIKLNLFFNFLFLIYIIVDVGILTFNILVKPQNELELIQENSTLNIANKTSQTNLKPDVYFLVFDEYSSSVSLKQNYGFDNSSLDSFLISKGFFISNQSKSNYTYTIFSLASTLNMNYFKNATDLNFPDDFGLVWKFIYYNKVFKTFQDEGYDIKNFSFFNINEYPAQTESFSKSWALKFLFDKSLYSAFSMAHLWIEKTHYTHLLKNKLADLDTELKTDNGHPKFMYIHFLLPHHPYVFKSNGDERNVFDYTQKTLKSNNDYINQLFFTNKVIKNVISKIMLSEKKKIIILEGDHGNRFYNLSDTSAKAKYFKDKNDFKNLNAYYFFDKNYSQLHDSISPVNSFRIVFNQYFNKQYSVLKDSIVF